MGLSEPLPADPLSREEFLESPLMCLDPFRKEAMLQILRGYGPISGSDEWYNIPADIGDADARTVEFFEDDNQIVFSGFIQEKFRGFFIDALVLSVAKLS